MGLGRGGEEEVNGRGARPHLVMFPFPALGHIRPMMQLAQFVARRGVLVTFVNTEHNHHLILRASTSPAASRANDVENSNAADPSHYTVVASPLPEHSGLPIRLAALPDGLAPGENRTADLPQLIRALNSMEPILLRFLQQQLQPPATCLVADIVNVDVPAIAAQLRIATASFWCPSIASARLLHDVELLQINGDVAPDGIPVHRSEYIKTSYPGVPRIRGGELPWTLGKDEDIVGIYQFMMKRFKQMCMAPWFLCNSSIELEKEVAESFPRDVNICPVGPLFAYDFKVTQLDGQPKEATANRTSVGFWKEEGGCVRWLDGQEEASVVYVSFGSLAMFNQAQLEELALGLEATKKAFLWVVRADLMDGTTARLPKGFEERTRGRGLVVAWAPQEAVLAHRAIGCFVTHCGWNSTMEAVYNGVPTVAWPYFADQFVDRSYLVETWKVGRPVHYPTVAPPACNGDHRHGLVTRTSIHDVVLDVMQSQDMRRRAQELGSRLRASVQCPAGASISKLDEFLTEMWRIATMIDHAAPSD